MNRLRRLLVPSALACALVLALASAGTAAAQTLSGAGSSLANPAIPGEGDVLKATASYDSVAGTLTISATTREAPGGESELILSGGVASVKGECSYALLEREESASDYPIFSMRSPYSSEAEGPPAWWFLLEKKGEVPSEQNGGPGSKLTEGTTTTLSATTPRAVGRPFNCAVVGVSNNEAGEPDNIVFPLLAPPAPPVPPAAPVPPPSIPPPAPIATPKPGVLSLAPPKPLTLKPGKWAKLKVTLADTGGSPIGPIAIRAKAPKGVVLKPGGAKIGLPALLPGQSWTVSFNVKLTEEAKATSKVSLSATAPGLTAGSVVVLKSAAGPAPR